MLDRVLNEFQGWRTSWHGALCRRAGCLRGSRYAHPARELCSHEQSSLMCHGCHAVLVKCFHRGVDRMKARPIHGIVWCVVCRTASGTKQFWHRDVNAAKNMVGAVCSRERSSLAFPRDDWRAPKMSPSRSRMRREPCSLRAKLAAVFQSLVPYTFGWADSFRPWHGDRPVALGPTIVRHARGL